MHKSNDILPRLKNYGSCRGWMMRKKILSANMVVATTKNQKNAMSNHPGNRSGKAAVSVPLAILSGAETLARVRRDIIGCTFIVEIL